MRAGIAGCNTEPEFYYNGRIGGQIPDYVHGSQGGQGVAGDVYYQHSVNSRYKNYLAENGPNAQRVYGQKWVKFPCWSGQDGENRLKDINGARMAHRNEWHIVNLENNNLGQTYRLRANVVSEFEQSEREMEWLLKQRSDDEDKRCAYSVRDMINLDPGTFVYFEVDGNKLKSIGRHYRYLFRKGRVRKKVETANKALSDHDPFHCPVQHLAGWADKELNNGKAGMKGRIWVGMAIGPDADNMRRNGRLVRKNLRILASQIPKAANFYLKGGGYNDNLTSKIRGRKFYWHDPKWRDPMWDNQDLHQGDHTFENPDPANVKLWKQWSEVEVICPTRDESEIFSFDIRVMNFSQNELNLLLTALAGFDLQVANGCLRQDSEETWCHKIGHARPYMGSAVITVTGAAALNIDDTTWEPVIVEKNLQNWQSELTSWQNSTFAGSDHIAYLKHVMTFNGAYQANKEELNARITYPLAQRRNDTHNNALTWVDGAGNKLSDKRQPKTYSWFGEDRNRNKNLPEPAPNESQSLNVSII